MPKADTTLLSPAPAYLLVASHLYPLLKPVTRIGTSEHNELILDDPLAARQHAEVRRTPEGFRLAEGSSGAEIFVRQQPVSEMVLDSGTVFQIGYTPLLFVLGWPVKDTDTRE